MQYCKDPIINVLLQLCNHFKITNGKAHDALADLNATWEVVKSLLSKSPMEDLPAAGRLLECWLYSPRFDELPPTIVKGMPDVLFGK